MGSSILASLSEAGGNDPELPVSGPLPPHIPVSSDRVGTRPAQGHMQVGCPNFSAATTHRAPIFNDLGEWRGSPRTSLELSPDYRPESASAVAWVKQMDATLVISLSYSLFGARACGIMEWHSGLG
jgi:hypothetical protein